ncbi:MAG: hypothetical protein R2722_12295 [Tessaracoccus sp.]
MDADLDTLATALYVTSDDLLKAHPEQLPPRPATGFHPRITDAELVTLAVIQAPLQDPERTTLPALRPPSPDLTCSRTYCRPPTTDDYAH